MIPLDAEVKCTLCEKPVDPTMPYTIQPIDKVYHLDCFNTLGQFSLKEWLKKNPPGK